MCKPDWLIRLDEKLYAMKDILRDYNLSLDEEFEELKHIIREERKQQRDEVIDECKEVLMGHKTKDETRIKNEQRLEALKIKL